MDIIERLAVIKNDVERANGFSQFSYEFYDIMKKMQKLSYCIPSVKTYEMIYNYMRDNDLTTILSIGSGSGFFELHLQDYLNLKNLPCDIIASDIVLSETQYMPIEQIDAESATEKYKNIDILLIPFPEYNKDWAYNALKKFKGDSVIYIGEGRGGCTADDQFHEYLDKEFEEISRDHMLQFNGYHIGIFINKRKL